MFAARWACVWRPRNEIGELPPFGLVRPVQIACRWGVLEARALIVDTGEVKLVGDGEVDLADRQLDLVIRPHAKDFSLLSASAPIEIDGPLMNPNVSTDVSEAAASILTPIELGQAEDAPCRRLIEEARAAAGARATITESTH